MKKFFTWFAKTFSIKTSPLLINENVNISLFWQAQYVIVFSETKTAA